MNYVSTRDKSKVFKFKDVFLKGLADDGGLFVPEVEFKFNDEQLNSLKGLDYNQLAKEIISPFVDDFIKDDDLSKIIGKSYSSFRKNNVIDLIKVEDRFILELFHGPTLAFKDVAMQLLGNFYEYYLEKNDEKINIVVATSGDTGAAAIEAIKGKKNLNIFVLHPHNRISSVQRKIMTTVKDNNVFNIAINGNFDDCQNLVKSMFEDKNFSKSINMSGVNSINWARIIAQSVYYFYSYFLIEDKTKPINFSVPTGNFGDVYAGYLAKKMGLPINKLVVATNQNDILHRAISEGKYVSEKVSETLSPSMDIQIASNFERLIYDLNNKDDKLTSGIMKSIKRDGSYIIDETTLKKINSDFLSASLNENEVLKTISNVYSKNNLILDPHTAIGFAAFEKVKLDGNNIVLATAHPSKFPDAINKAIKMNAELPKELQYVLSEKENYDIIENNLESIKKTHNRESKMNLKENDQIPNSEIFIFENNSPVKKNLHDLLKGKKVVLFGLPGAYTSVCSAKHLPGYVNNFNQYKEKGVDHIICISVNDPFVMDAWGKEHKVEDKIIMMGDPFLNFTKSIGADVDKSERGLGIRSNRYTMLIDDLKVVKLQEEEDTGSCEISAAENFLQLV